jgi:hypothetical protein
MSTCDIIATRFCTLLSTARPVSNGLSTESVIDEDACAGFEDVGL